MELLIAFLFVSVFYLIYLYFKIKEVVAKVKKDREESQKELESKKTFCPHCKELTPIRSFCVLCGGKLEIPGYKAKK